MKNNFEYIIKMQKFNDLLQKTNLKYGAMSNSFNALSGFETFEKINELTGKLILPYETISNSLDKIQNLQNTISLKNIAAFNAANSINLHYQNASLVNNIMQINNYFGSMVCRMKIQLENEARIRNALINSINSISVNEDSIRIPENLVAESFFIENPQDETPPSTNNNTKFNNVSFSIAKDIITLLLMILTMIQAHIYHTADTSSTDKLISLQQSEIDKLNETCEYLKSIYVEIQNVPEPYQTISFPNQQTQDNSETSE